MKANLNLSIPQPCSEKWSTFTTTAAGGFCGTCQKTVIDFTRMSDEAILRYFKNKPEYTCGRFRPQQVKSYAEVIPAKASPGWMLLKAGFVSLLLIFISKKSVAQNHLGKVKIENVEQADTNDNRNSDKIQDRVARGVVNDENGYPMPGVNVLLKWSTIGTSTDADGQFEFPQKLKEGDVLVFSFIGYKTEEYIVRKDITDVVEVQCKLDADIMGEVAIEEIYSAKRGFRNWWSKVQKLF